MNCIRTKQIHEYNSNIIYTQYKQQQKQANTKKNTNTPIPHTHPTHPSHTPIPHTHPPDSYRYDFTDDVMKQFGLCIQRHTNIQYKT